MSERNRHGLARPIPSAIAREVRQKCGFGCVVCGNAVYQYDHFDPPFEDALTHDANGIVLLCGGCHDRKTRGQLSIQTVRKWNNMPFCKREGHSWGVFDIGDNGPPVVWLGNLLLWECETLIKLNGEPILQIRAPEDQGGPFRLTARLRDSEGRQTLAIIDNEWQAPHDNWDVDVIGQRITVRRARGDICLVIRIVPPSGLHVERLSMTHRGVSIDGATGERMRFRTPDGREFSTDWAQIVGAAVGISLTDGGLSLGLRSRFVREGKFDYKPPPFPGTHRTATTPRLGARVGRNDPCPCGSSKKFKHCHGAL